MDKKSNCFNHLRVFTVCIYKVHGLLGVPETPSWALAALPVTQTCIAESQLMKPGQARLEGKWLLLQEQVSS